MNKIGQPLLRPERLNLHGQERFFQAVNKTLASGDGMYSGNDAYYFEVGANALSLIHRALLVANRSCGDVSRILDYACGFGRVLRWLRAAFPSAEILATDADAKAVKALREIFNVPSVVLDLSLTEELGSDFDLIWVGSLITHLPGDQLKPLFTRFRSLLSGRGVLVFTTHGPYVARRIAAGEKDYGLDPTGMTTILAQYKRSGYGFSPYPKQASYGISICTASKLLSLLEDAGLQPIFYQERGWVRHQDCIAVTKAP